MDQASVRNTKMGKIPKMIGVIILLFVGGLFVLQSSEAPVEQSKHDPEQVEAASTGIPDGYERRRIDGIPIPAEDQPEKLFAVMVENSAEAWPLSGLADARLVIEAPVEGNIPRLMAFFDETQRVDQIGPVRSARPYYIRWAQGFGAMYTHVGGSPEGLSILRGSDLPQLNEFFWGRFFWRADYRYAPHNVYTSVKNLEEAYIEREFTQEVIPSWNYDESIPEKGQQVKSVSIPFSSQSKLYTARWDYNDQENNYLRFQGGEQQEDGSGDFVYAKNIVVLFTGMTTIDNEGRKSVTTIGEGRSLLFRDGEVFEMQWQKEAYDSPLEFYFSDDQQARFLPGTTWIEVVPLSTEIEIISAD